MNMTTHDTIAVCGGSGFIGRHLIDVLSREHGTQIRLLAHRRDPSAGVAVPTLATVAGDLMYPDLLGNLVTEGCTVVNLAYLSAATREQNLIAVTNLAQACRAGGARRLVHLSTAMVVGAAPDDVVTETTTADPRSEYEHTKLEIEHELARIARGAFELVILRPTAVFGSYGQNLIKLADELLNDWPLKNYIRSCLHGYRRMNLVCVENVAAAIRFATTVPVAADSPEIFLVSDDDEAPNNYRDVETILRRQIDRGPYAAPPLAVPRAAFKLLLKLGGRSNINPNRVYSNAKLINAGFRKTKPFTAALAAFIEWRRRALQV